MNQPPLNPDAIRELTEAIRLTVEYVGTGTLPAIPGWSWYDAMVKYAPEDAEVLRAMEPLPEASAALSEVTSAKASAWEEGFQAGWEEHEDPGAFVNDFWDAKTPNPYADEANS